MGSNPIFSVLLLFQIILLFKGIRGFIKAKYTFCIYDGLESDWLRHFIWVGESLCSSHSNPKLIV